MFVERRLRLRVGVRVQGLRASGIQDESLRIAKFRDLGLRLYMLLALRVSRFSWSLGLGVWRPLFGLQGSGLRL